jgi:hypothetical protein
MKSWFNKSYKDEYINSKFFRTNILLVVISFLIVPIIFPSSNLNKNILNLEVKIDSIIKFI